MLFLPYPSGVREGKKNHFQKTHFHPSFLKQHDLVDPISSIQFCLNHPELHSENTPRKNSVHPSYRIPPLQSVASFCHHLSSKWWKEKIIHLLGILLHRELPEEQNKVGFVKDNSTSNHKVLSHMQIKCIVKLPLKKN